MNKIFEQCVVDGELTPELIKRKQELDQSMEAELAEVEAGRGRMWVPKSRQFADIQNKYEEIWERELEDAGYLLRPVFEDWYDTLSKLNEAKADTERLVAFAGQELTDRFIAIRNKIEAPENDLYYWIKNKTVEELEQFVSSIEETKSKTQVKKTTVDHGANLVCETEHWKVYHITTASAAQIYGRDTKWCISSIEDGEKHWRSYTDSNDIFFLFAKSTYNARGRDNKFALVIDPERGYYEAFDQQDNKLEDLDEIPFIDEIEIPDYFPLDTLYPWPEDED